MFNHIGKGFGWVTFDTAKDNDEGSESMTDEGSEFTATTTKVKLYSKIHHNLLCTGIKLAEVANIKSYQKRKSGVLNLVTYLRNNIENLGGFRVEVYTLFV